MKNYLATILLVCIFALSLSACGGGNGEKTDSSTDTNALSENDTETVAETEGTWEILESIECEKHHRDYHVIPANLAQRIGIDECNAWAKEIKKSAVELSDEVKCSCPDFNIKNFIDRFEITREDFVSHGDVVYYGTYDTAVLYEMTAEEVEKYYIYSDALIDKTIKSQHYLSIEKYFQYEYLSEIYDMIVYDEELGIGIMPSIPQLVQALGIDRDAFEDILEECTENNVEIYGRSYSFDYDMGLIYNEDGTFKELPTFDGLSEYETILKLNRMFTDRDN